MWTYSRTTRQILRCNVRTHEPPVVVAENVQDWAAAMVMAGALNAYPFYPDKPNAARPGAERGSAPPSSAQEARGRP